MSNLNISLNKAVYGTSTNLGTGTKGAKAFFKKLKKGYLVEADYVFDGSVDWTDEYANSLVAEGKIIVLEDVSVVEAEDVANAYEDIGDGVTSLDTEGLFGLKLKFRKGMYFNNVLNSLSGVGRFDFMGSDADGKLIGTFADNGTSLKGYKLGTHQVELPEGQFDSNSTLQVFKLQLLDSSEVYNYAIKYPDDSFNANNISPINEISLELTTPSGSDTSVTVKASYKQGGEVLPSVAFGQWNVKINGATQNPTGGDDSAESGTYVLTGITAISTDDVVSISLYDNANNRAGISVGGYLFKSSTVSKTAV